MQCPWCKYSFRLGWTMYVRSPLGRFSCPVCDRRFRLERSFAYLKWLTTAAVAFVGVPLSITYLVTSSWLPAGVAAVIGAAGFVLPFDRWLEDNFRKSRKIPAPQAPT